MSYTYTYNSTYITSGNFDMGYMDITIRDSVIAETLIGIDKNSDSVSIHIEFENQLTVSHKTILDGIVQNHDTDPNAGLSPYVQIVRNAVAFYVEIMEEFAAQNITQGITVYGKTKAVADYLQNVMRYGQSGSLYEVVAEIDTLIAAGIPGDLSPFVTEPVLINFKTKVNNYLGV